MFDLWDHTLRDWGGEAHSSRTGAALAISVKEPRDAALVLLARCRPRGGRLIKEPEGREGSARRDHCPASITPTAAQSAVLGVSRGERGGVRKRS